MRRVIAPATAAALAALAALGAACRGPGAAGGTALIDSVVADNTDARGRLLRELEAEVRASYQRPTLDAAAAAAAIDPSVGLVAIGVGPLDLSVRLAPTVRWPILAVDGAPVEIVSRALELSVSNDETVGWSFDEATLELPVCGRVASIPIRIFQVYVRDSDRWSLVAEHLAYPQAMGRWLDDAVGPEGPRLSESVERQPESAAARAAIIEAIAPDGDRALTWDAGAGALAIWPDAAQVLRGGATRTGPSLAASLDASALALDGIRLALGPTRSVAIASATLLATVARAGVAGGPIELRFRATFVVERIEDVEPLDPDDKRAKDRARHAWRVRAAMVSIPITPRELVERSFGVTAGTPSNGNVPTRCE